MRSGPRRHLIPLFSFVLSACGAPAVAPSRSAPPPAPATAPATATATAPATAARPRSLRVAFLLPDDASAPPRLTLVIDGPAAELTTLAADELPSDVTVTDARGGAVTARRDGGRLALIGQPTPPLTVTCALTAPIASGPRRALVAGGAIAVPDAWTTFNLDWDTSTPKDPELHVASTLGATPPLATTRARLARSAWQAGPGGVARFRGAEGRDDAAWVGYTAFEPRTIAAEIAVFRSSLDDYFGTADDRSSTALFFVEPREKGDFLVSRRAGGVLARVGAGEPYAAPLRLAVAHELVHAYLGEAVWLGAPSAAKMRWFHEGVTRWVARERLLSAGLLDAAEYTEEVGGALATLAASPLRAEPNDALARAPRGGLLVQVARGATYAARADALLRAKTRGEKSLRTIFRELIRKALEAHAELPEGAFEDAVARELGEPEREVMKGAIERGAPAPLPSGAFGPCFRVEPSSYESYDLGFDEDATAVEPGKGPAGLAPKGPAARAGMRPGDVVAKVTSTFGRADKDAVVEVKRPRATGGFEDVTLRYRPAGPRRPGVALRFVPDADKSCAALRKR